MPGERGLKKGHDKKNSQKDKNEKKDKKDKKVKKDKKMERCNQVPPSREKEHKIIVTAANDIAAEIQKFCKKFFSKNKDEMDFQQAIEALQKVYEMWNMETVDEIPSWKDFIAAQDTKKIDKATRDTEGYVTVEKLCDRGKYFETLIPKVRKKLIACLQYHLYKYCRSFEELSEEYEIRPVREYEENIKDNKLQIDSKLDAINDNILKYGELKKPFATFVREGHAHGKLIKEICLHIVEICHIAKGWVKQDIDYPERLYEESQFSSSYHEKLMDDCNNLTWKRQQSLEMLTRRERLQWRLEVDFDGKRREKRKLKRSRDTVESLLAKCEKNISDKEYEIDVLQDEKRGGVSPRNKSIASEDLEVAQRDLVKLKERKASLEKQLERMERDHEAATQRHDEAKQDLEDNDTVQEDLRTSVNDIDLELKNIRERTDAIENKVSIVRYIRELTLSSDTLRKIQQKRRDRQAQQAEKDKASEPLEEACKYVADKIGNDWKRLYPRLPFCPTRDQLKRHSDISLISSIAAKNDWTDDKQALHSFSKWRNFNRRCDVAQLSRSLKMARMRDLAKNVERHFLVKSMD